MLKLKLNRPSANAPADAPANEAPSATPTSATTPGPTKLKIAFKPQAAPSADSTGAPSTEPAVKAKRKYTKKPKVDGSSQPSGQAPKLKLKRPRDENGDEESPAPKRKPKPTAKIQALKHEEDEDDEDVLAAPAPVPRAPRPAPIRTQSMKLSLKTKLHSKSTPIIKMKGAGKPPVRPPGVGYDSEAEEAEVDPAIESQFILRMVPGANCDLLRKSIEEKTIGKSKQHGGPGVLYRFFDREGRRAMVTIADTHYAATMVDLPCVVESMKSWNKKDWVKTADICQMLLVLGDVPNEEEAKKYPLPKEVNNIHQYAHGLTPPMKAARQRRFRPRISYHRIEQVEEATETQLQADRQAQQQGGRIKWEVVDVHDRSDTEEESSEDDAEGEDDEMLEAPQYGEGEGETPMADMMDEDDLAQMLAEGLVEEDDGVDGEGEVVGTADAEGEADDLFGDDVEAETPATSHDVAMHALGETSNTGIETAASTPNADTESPDADDDDGESDEDEEVDEEAAARQQEIEDIRAEIREIDQNIATFVAQRDRSKANPILRERVQAKIDKQNADREVNLGKLRALGVDTD